jgi:hypothetical protein
MINKLAFGAPAISRLMPGDDSAVVARTEVDSCQSSPMSVVSAIRSPGD